MPKVIDLIGEKFGRLSVIKKAGKTKDRSTLWKCQSEREKIMRIFTKLEYHWDIDRYVLDNSESFMYNGNIHKLCGATGAQKSIEQSQQSFMAQAQQQASTVFGAASQVFQGLMSTFAPIVAAGPSQRGFSQAENAALQSQAITNAGVSFRNAKQALGENLAAAGGGNTALPSGVAANEELQLAEAGANNTANQLNQITEANYATGRQNYQNAVQGELNATNVYGAATGAVSGANQAGSDAATSANNIAQADNSWMQMVGGALGGVAGGVTAHFLPPGK